MDKKDEYIEEVYYEEEMPNLDPKTSSIQSSDHYMRPNNNMALGFGRKGQDAFYKDSLNNKKGDIDNNDKKLGQNKNRTNPSNDAAKNLATGNRNNNQNKNKDDKQNKDDKNSKNNKDKNSNSDKKGSSLKKEDSKSGIGSKNEKTSGVSSLKNRLNPLKRNTKHNTEEKNTFEGGLKALWRKIPLIMRIKILAIGGAVVGVLLVFLIIFAALMGSSEESFGGEYGYINGVCKDGVTVTERGGGIVGTYPLEEYIAGVIAHENVYVNNGNIEAMKAQAIAARTYALYRTNFCEKSIENSEYAQTMTDPTELTTKATQETAGMVLQYKGEIFSTEYDSYVNNGSCDSNGCTSTYIKIPSKEKHTVKLSKKFVHMIVGGHGRGMSQLAARDLQDKGYDYEQILKFFYADGVEIAKLSATADGEGLVRDEKTGFMMRLSRPQRTNAFYYQQNKANLGKYCEGECAWYGTGRAAEILSSVGSSKTWTANPDGGGFCYTADAKNFKISYNYRKPKQGSIVSWTNGSYGHVAIVEQVKGNWVTISEAYLSLGYKVGSSKWSKDYVRSAPPNGCQTETAKTNCESGSGTGCFHTATLSLSQMKNYYGSYNFACYIYLVEG